jgi:hypothetical protein
MEIILRIVSTVILYYLIIMRVDVSAPVKIFKEAIMLSRLLSAFWHAVFISAVFFLIYPVTKALLLFTVLTYFYFILLNLTVLVRRKGWVLIFHDGIIIMMYCLLFNF